MRRLYSLIILPWAWPWCRRSLLGMRTLLRRFPLPARPSRRDQSKGERKILYYRNPMGAPDTSPVPKKDSMGMDYIPVYADEQETRHGQGQPRQDPAHRREDREGRSPRHRPGGARRRQGGARRVAPRPSSRVRSDGYIEDCSSTRPASTSRRASRCSGFYSPQIQLAQTDLIVAMRAEGQGLGPRRDKTSKAPCSGCATSAFPRAASTRCARPRPIRGQSIGRRPRPAT